MKATKFMLALSGALVVLGWMISRSDSSAIADPVVDKTGLSPAVIDASEYPNLQAAFDAVPMSGGLVKLPPGDFRLTEPLVLERPETRIEGAGAATRLPGPLAALRAGAPFPRRPSFCSCRCQTRVG